jgi:phosphoglycerate dehydrogenase-like enzyme
LDRFTRAGQWGVDQVPHTVQIEGQVLGIIGFGKIGRSVAWRAKAFGLKVAAYDPYLEREHIVAQGAAPFELDDLLSVADFVSLHLPLSEGTFHMMDARRLAMMKPSAILINTARGAIIDESALVETLTRRRIAGAALDVFEREPPGSDHPLFALDNVVLTPHCAAHTQLATDKVRRGALDNVHRALRNQPLENVVNRAALRSQAASMSSGRLKPV